MADPDVAASKVSLAFNQGQLMTHVKSAQDHVTKLGNHLEQYVSDPKTFRAERATLVGMRSDSADLWATLVRLNERAERLSQRARTVELATNDGDVLRAQLAAA